MAALLLVLLSLLVMLSRVTGPVGQRVDGREEGVIMLGVRERVRYHRTGLYAFAVILLLLAATRLLSMPMQVLAVAACYAVLMVPIRYRFTSVGVAVNRVVFRRWDEFSGVDRGERSVTLVGTDGHAALTLRLLGAHQDEVLALIRRHVRIEAGAAPVPKKGGRPTKRHHAR